MAIIVKTVGGRAWVYQITGSASYILLPSGAWQRVVEGNSYGPTTTTNVLQPNLTGAGVGYPGVVQKEDVER